MSTDMVTCSPDTLLSEVVEELRTNPFSCLVVVRGDVPVGIITESSLLGILVDLLAEEDWESYAVEHFMSVPIKTIESDLTLFEAVTAMKREAISHAPIVNMQGKLVGMLSQSDIADAYYQAQVKDEN